MNDSSEIGLRRPKRIGEFSRDSSGEYEGSEGSKKVLKNKFQGIPLSCPFRNAKILQTPLEIKYRPKWHIMFMENRGIKPRILMWMKENVQKVWNAEENR